MKNQNVVTRSNRRNWSPFWELRSEMDKLFDDFWGGSSAETSLGQVWSPVCDVTEDEGHYLVTLEMAGIPKDQIKIEVLNNQLIVSGERKSDESKKEKGLVYSERRYGMFHRAFTLPSGLDTDKVEASYEDGILRVMLPKAEGEKPRQIKISSGGGNSFFGKLIGQSSTKEKEEERSSSQKSSDKMAS